MTDNTNNNNTPTTTMKNRKIILILVAIIAAVCIGGLLHNLKDSDNKFFKWLGKNATNIAIGLALAIGGSLVYDKIKEWSNKDKGQAFDV